MSKQYKVDLKIDISNVNAGSGFLMKPVDKEIDERGIKERTGAEVFTFLVDVAIQGANPKVSFAELQGFRRVIKDLKNCEETGEYTGNKTDIDIIKNAVRNNRNWPNSDEMFDILDQIIKKLNEAPEINASPTPSS
jgi:hypothetical protein